MVVSKVLCGCVCVCWVRGVQAWSPADDTVAVPQPTQAHTCDRSTNTQQTRQMTHCKGPSRAAPAAGTSPSTLFTKMPPARAAPTQNTCADTPEKIIDREVMALQ